MRKKVLLCNEKQLVKCLNALASVLRCIHSKILMTKFPVSMPYRQSLTTISIYPHTNTATTTAATATATAIAIVAARGKRQTKEVSIRGRGKVVMWMKRKREKEYETNVCLHRAIPMTFSTELNWIGEVSWIRGRKHEHEQEYENTQLNRSEVFHCVEHWKEIVVYPCHRNMRTVVRFTR